MGAFGFFGFGDEASHGLGASALQRGALLGRSGGAARSEEGEREAQEAEERLRAQQELAKKRLRRQRLKSEYNLYL